MWLRVLEVGQRALPGVGLGAIALVQGAGLLCG